MNTSTTASNKKANSVVCVSTDSSSLGVINIDCVEESTCSRVCTDSEKESSDRPYDGLSEGSEGSEATDHSAVPHPTQGTPYYLSAPLSSPYPIPPPHPISVPLFLSPYPTPHNIAPTLPHYTAPIPYITAPYSVPSPGYPLSNPGRFRRANRTVAKGDSDPNASLAVPCCLGRRPSFAGLRPRSSPGRATALGPGAARRSKAGGVGKLRLRAV